MEIRIGIGTLVLGAVLIMAGCGGGGGSNEPATNPPPSSSSPPPSNPPPSSPPPPDASATLSVATDTIEFNATNLTSTPASVSLSGSVTGTLSGTLYVRIEVGGTAVSNVTHINVNQSTGTATGTIWPRWPGELGVGTYHDTITVSACINDISCATGHVAGSPRVINVTYNVTTSVQGQVFAPRVVAANASGTVIVRSQDLGSVTDIAIGGSSVTTTAVSPTERQADHSGLAPGTHAISLNGGAVPFDGTVHAVPAVAFAPESLAYPSTPSEIGNVLYDAERQRVLVVARYTSSATNQLLTYSHAGSSIWSAQTPLTIPNLQDIAFSPDGTRLLAVTDAALLELDADTYDTIASGAPTGVMFETGWFISRGLQWRMMDTRSSQRRWTAVAAWPGRISTRLRAASSRCSSTRHAIP